MAVVAAGLTYGSWVVIDHRLVPISPGQIYQSAEMAPAELVEVSREHGLRAVLDLRDTRPEAIEAERVALEKAGIKHLHVPSLQEPTPETIEIVLGLMADPQNQPLLVHCEHGEGRSVLMAALHRVENEGWTNEAAWRGSARLPGSLQFLGDVFPGLGSFGRQSPKGQILFDYQRSAGKAPPTKESPLR